MLRTRSSLSRPVLKWVSQVAASLGATLCATLIWSAVPHPSAAPAPELTSGGKFAARAVEAVAYDGLDAMPLPRAAAPAPTFAAEAGIRSLVHPAAWEDRAPAAPERPARALRAARAVPRVEIRRPAPAEAVQAAAVPAEAVVTGAAAPSEPGLLGSVLPSVASTARTAWSLTASAGDALVSRVVPQLP